MLQYFDMHEEKCLTPFACVRGQIDVPKESLGKSETCMVWHNNR